MSLKYFLLIFGLFSAANTLRLPEERIVNGKSIEISEAPWQVAILKVDQFQCGGSILSERIILTAAHCVLDNELENESIPLGHLSIVAGSKYWHNGGQRIAVENYKYNKNWKVGLLDIAILRLTQPLQYNSNVKPITIASQNPKVNDIAFVSGWGTVSYNGRIDPYDLQGVETSIVDVNVKLIATYSDGKGAFFGDSGGPLAVNGKLVGVVSGGPGPDSNALYTNVVTLKNWIDNAIKELEHA